MSNSIPSFSLRSLLGILLAVIASLSPAAAANSTASKPNIIFILTDDLGYGDVGAFFRDGQRTSGSRGGLMTPELDRLASSGARLTHHYCAAPVCAPSRASVLSGLHQGHANVRNNQFDKALAPNHTLATVLRQAGYATAAFGKWGLQGLATGGAPNWPAHPQNRGFDFFFGYIRHVDGHEHYPKEAPYRNRDNTPKKIRSPTNEEADDAKPSLFGKEVWENRREISDTLDKCYTTDLFTARAKHWIAAHQTAKPGQPFFAYLAYDTPHAVTELPTMAYPAGRGLKGGLQWTGTPGKAINTAGGKIDSWTHPDFANATYDHDQNPATAEQPWADVYRRYATSVRRIDDGVADVMQTLRDLGIAENTLVVFTSDNGPSLESYLKEDYSPEFFAGYGPFDGVKRDLWEGGTRVPTIAHWPARIRGGLTLASPSAHWDWLPTFAEAAGLPAPANADGVSLIPALAGNTLDRRGTPIYFEYRQDGRTPEFPAFEPGRRNRWRREMQALRIGNLMGVRYDVKSADDPFEIYDVSADPKQRKNLADSPAHAALQRQLKDTVLQSRRPDASAPRPYDSTLIPPARGTSAGAGLSWKRYVGDFPWVPTTTSLNAAASGTTGGLDLTKVTAGSGPFAAVFEGYLQVPADGEYTFTVATDTGAIVRLHNATLLDCDVGYAAGSEKSASVALQAGLHPIKVTYRHVGSGRPHLALDWNGPNVTTGPVPATAFHQRR